MVNNINEKKTHKKFKNITATTDIKQNGGTPNKKDKKTKTKNKIVKYILKKLSMFVKEQRIALNQGKTRKNLFKWYTPHIEIYLTITLYNDKKLLYGILQQIKFYQEKKLKAKSFVENVIKIIKKSMKLEKQKKISHQVLLFLKNKKMNI